MAFEMPPGAWHDVPPDGPPFPLEADTDVPTRLETLPDGRESVTFGDVARAAEFGHRQGDNSFGFCQDCGLCSCETVLNQFDVPVTEQDVVAFAVANGLCDVQSDAAGSGGTTLEQQAEILRRHDVPAHVEAGQSMEDLAGFVEQGRGVIIGANAGVLWNDANAYGDGYPNHAVTVTGVARDPGTGDLQGFYVNDSGTGAAGQFVAAPLMNDAWLTVGGACVVTDVTQSGDNR
ncbi:hypothetical protein [Actinoplanes subglobosus]|uniref:Peptidase C39-like domain-containing protein n=1 Tax=Actinoplanes subglobosus TaxID=1547892 RepID=A0ABV8J971_9ACTN